MGVFRCKFSAYSVAFSPYSGTRLAVACAQHFGIVGNGALHVLDLNEPYMREVYTTLTPDNLFDVCWNEGNESQLLVASGDKTVKLLDMNYPQPLLSLNGHQAEVFSVHSNYQNPSLALSGSYDTSLKLWDLTQSACVATFAGHSAIVYAGVWHPKDPQRFLSASGDRTARIWDARAGVSIAEASAHAGEVLSCDWDKYSEGFVTASVDQNIRVWDARNLSAPVLVMAGHTLAIRRVKYSPFSSQIIASASYDMSVRVWNTADPKNPIIHLQHTEFSVGVDFSLFDPKALASCGWDRMVCVWPYDQAFQAS